jgi:Methyltransferase domain
VSRALRALSITYVEQRHRIAKGAALSGAGKRAAFALFYAPLHYLLIREIVRSLPGALGSPRAPTPPGRAVAISTPRAPSTPVPTLIDLGCGTGAAGAAWASAAARVPRLVGVDRHPWMLGEAAWTYRTFGFTAQTRQGDLGTAALPRSPALIVAAYTVNELADASRDALLTRLLARAAHGDGVLVVEPIAGFVARWWGQWRDAVEGAGGRADDWRIRPDLPPIVARLDQAAGLDHRELTGRSLFIEPARA